MLNPYLLSYKDKHILEEYQNQRKEQQRKLNQFIGWSSIGFQGIQWLNMLSAGETSTQDVFLIILTTLLVFLVLYGLYQNRKNSLNSIKYFFLSTIAFDSQFLCSSFKNYFVKLSKFSMLIQGWTFGYIFIVQLLALPSWYQKLFVVSLAMISLGTTTVVQSEFQINNEFLVQLALISVLIIALFYIYEKYEKENFQNIHEQKRSLQEWKNLLNYTMASSIFVIVPEQPNKHKLRFWNQTFHEKFGHINNSEFLQSIQRISIKEHKSSGQLKNSTNQQNQNEININNQSKAEMNRNFGSEPNSTNNVVYYKQNSQHYKNRHFHHYNSSSSSSVSSSSSEVSPEQSSSNLLKKIDQIYQKLKQNRMSQSTKGSNMNTTKSFCPQIEEKYHNCLFKQSIVVSNDQVPNSSEENENKFNKLQKSKIKTDQESFNGPRGAAISNGQASPRKKTNHSIRKSQDNINSDINSTVNINQYYDIKLIGCYWDNQDAVMVIMDDISEKIINERLKETDEYKDQMLATVTHDLKTPLNGIIIMIKTLIETNQHSEEEMKVMKMVLQNANLLLSMIQDILDYSQIKRNVLRLAPDKFRIEEVLEEVYELFSIQAQEKGLELRIVKDGVLCNNQTIFSNTIPNNNQQCGTPNNQSSSSSKFGSSFGRIEKQKNAKLSAFFNNEDQQQQGGFTEQVTSQMLQTTKRKLAELAMNDIPQLSNPDYHSSHNFTPPLSATLQKSVSIRKSQSINYDIDERSNESRFKQSKFYFKRNRFFIFIGINNKDSHKKNEYEKQNRSADFINKNNSIKQEKDDEISIQKSSIYDEDLQHISGPEDNKFDEQSYTTHTIVVDQRKCKGKIQRQSSNLLKFSIDLMSNGKYCTEIYSDKRRIKQILINLVGNALKFTERGSISIEYNMHADKNLLELVVRDTGVGISESLQPKLFKVYSTFDHNNGSNRHGVGLGLAICKKLAQQLGPEKNITLTSTKGDGSAFSFFIYSDIGLAIKKYRQQQSSEIEVDEEEDEEDNCEEMDNEGNENNEVDFKNTHPSEKRENLDKSDDDSDNNVTHDLSSLHQQYTPNISKFENQNNVSFKKPSNKMRRQMYLNGLKPSFEDPLSNYASSNHSLFNQLKYQENQMTARIDETDQLNIPPNISNRTYSSIIDRRSKFSQDGISTNNQSIIKQNQNGQYEDDDPPLFNLEESCNYNCNLVDEMKKETRDRKVSQFSHKLGNLPKNDFIYSMNTTEDIIPQTTQQKLQSFLKLNLHPSVYMCAKDASVQNSTITSASSLQQKNEKQNPISLDILQSPESCSLGPYSQKSKTNYSSNEQHYNNQVKSTIGSIFKFEKAISQSVTKVQMQTSSKANIPIQQQTNHKQNSKSISKTQITQLNLIQQQQLLQSYIYEFKRPVNILIVDDTTFNLIALKAMLKKVKNVSLIVDAYNGKEALEKFKLNKFDLVLMDINMPIMDGQESMRHMRSYEKEIYLKISRKNVIKNQSCNSPNQRQHIISKKEMLSQIKGQGTSIICGDNISENQIFEVSEELSEKSTRNGQNILMFNNNNENSKQVNPLTKPEVESEAHNTSTFKCDLTKKKTNNLSENSPKFDNLNLKKQQNSDFQMVSNTLNSPKSIAVLYKQGRLSRRIKTESFDQNQNSKNIQEHQSPILISQLQSSKSNFSHLPQSQLSQSKNNIASSNSKSHWKAIIFAVTAYDQEQDVQKYLQAGANAHISKPIKLENLFSVINKFF